MAKRKRGVWVEPLLGKVKDFRRLRELLKFNIEDGMIAAGQNLKWLLKNYREELYSLLERWLTNLTAD